MVTKIVLLTGATGRQGQAFIRATSSSETNLDDSQAGPQSYHVLALTLSAMITSARQTLNSKMAVRRTQEEHNSENGTRQFGQARDTDRAIC